MADPIRILKIAADGYPHLRILATGSSTLAATKKFRDALTGRKHEIYLPPVLWQECREIFGIPDLNKRLLHGGLPESLLVSSKDADFFTEWIDSYYARDIQELFGIRNRIGFVKLFHLLMRQSGSLVDYTNLAKLSGLSYPTVRAHIKAMTIAHAFFLLTPFHGGGKREITTRSKCYGFDTGFVTHIRGWNDIRDEDRGVLWEHLVLDSLRSRFHPGSIFYWRDKSDRKVDFVLQDRENQVHAIECKMTPDQFEPRALVAFRELYPHGGNYIVSLFVKETYTRRCKNLSATFCPLEGIPIKQP